MAEFRTIIEKKIAKAEEDLALLREQFANDMNNGTDDTSPQFNPLKRSITMSKERNSQLASRQEKFIRDLKMQLFALKINVRHLQSYRQTN